MLISYCDIENNFTELELPDSGGIIGYAENNFIVIDALGISSMHMRLTVDGNSIFVEDLQSLNGTYLNEQLLTGKTAISHGDSILIGVVNLKFEKNPDYWEITAFCRDSSLFVVEESEPLSLEETDNGVSTAVTIIASSEVKAAIQSGDLQTLQAQTDCQLAPVQLPSFSFDSLQELGKYKIIKKIGKGGMGVVFLAKHKIMNTYRALKVLPHTVKEEHYDFFERFMREARLASEIRHPNIVGVMDAETDPVQKVSYIVMEFIDGGTLRRILKNQAPLPEIQALLIVKSITEALSAVAEHKIIHRDIKPDNIMFTRNGDVKLADLGIAKNEDDDVNLTRNDIMIGTPAYLSPEQIETPKDVDIRSDIYSLGATLYEMLTGSTPYAGKNTYEILQKMVSESIVDPRKKNPLVSAITARIVMKMLHKNPAKRYQSPQALLKVLNEVLQRYDVSLGQSIIRSAVLGTDLPQGVKKRVASGLGATFSFIFFSCRQSIAEFLLPAKASQSSRMNSSNAMPRKYFLFIMDSKVSDTVSCADFTIQAPPGSTLQAVSTSGYCQILQTSPDGKFEAKNLPPGEYQIRLKK